MKKIDKIKNKVKSYIQQIFKVFIQFYKLKKQKNPRFLLKIRDLSLHLGQATQSTTFDRHYVYHTAWASRILQKNQPELHIDISSSLFFVAVTSAFVPVRFYDYRPAEIKLSNLTASSADLCDLKFSTNSINSLSCMHVVEHIGLGRYGDPIDYNGDIKAINELKRVLAVGGQLLFVVPVGKESIINFNGQRIYTKEHVIELFTGLQLLEFTLIPENPEDGGLIIEPSIELLDKQINACGCFIFTKN